MIAIKRFERNPKYQSKCRALPDSVACVLGLVFAVRVICVLLWDLVSLICCNKLTLMLIN